MLKKREFTAYLVTMLMLAALLAMVPTIGQKAEGLTDMTTGWEYRWEETGTWRATETPMNPPGRDGRTSVQYRTRIPEESPPDAALFVYSIDVNATFSIHGTEVYRHGDPEHGRFIGWPWHLISIPEDAAGADLVVKVFSDYEDIGLFGEIFYGSRAAQIRRLYRRDVMRIIVCSVSVVIAAIFLGIVIARSEFRAYRYYSLVEFVLALRVFSLALTRQFVFENALLWEYLRQATYIVATLSIALLIGEIVGERAKRLTRWLAFAIAGVLVVTLTLSLTGITTLAGNYGVLDAVSAVAMLILAAATVVAGHRGNDEARLLTVNFLVAALFASYSILMFNGFLPWSDEIDYLMLFHFSMGLMYILIRRFVIAHTELTAANSVLEMRVAARTRELEESNRALEVEKDQLQYLSITDSLTKLKTRAYVLSRLQQMISGSIRYTRPVSVVLFDIDHFKRVNDEHGHQTGDEVLRRVAGTILENLRDSDVAGRYGGEEFLLVLPDTDVNEAGFVAERIRSQIELMPTGDSNPPVTVSAGVAGFREESMEMLLKRADVCLYQAKDGGRNLIVQ